MKYDFDSFVDRKQTNDLKWHSDAVSRFLPYDFPEDMIPMWLADTDFACAPVIVEALRKRVDQQIFGYCAPRESFYKAVCYWEKKQFDWDVKPEWILTSHTVVAAINVAIRAFTEEGDGVIIQQPVYDPFASIVKNTGRVVVNNALLLNNGKFEINFEELEQLAAEPKNKLMILCSPHNPVGRVWTEEELRRIAEICIKHDVLVVSDEIHSDIIFKGYKHHPLLSLDERYADRFIHLTAPGKTFNVAGLRVSICIIPNKELREAFQSVQKKMSLGDMNTFGIEAVIAAYTPEGHEWMEQELEYMEANVDFVEEYIRTNMPGVSMVRPEATFLCWLDMSGLHLGDEELFKRVLFDAAVICVPGTWFGPGGEEHLRLNVGCPRSMLKEALDRITKAIYR